MVRTGLPRLVRLAVLATGLLAIVTPDRSTALDAGPRAAAGACFLLREAGAGEVRRDPAALCTTRVTPASTFKIAHAIAALDARVVAGKDTVIGYAGNAVSYDAWRQDHTLASAMRWSVVWYFQRLAERLGMERERDYLGRFRYGNADPSSGLTTFWLGGSLAISPEEQVAFLERLYSDALPVRPEVMRTVREILIQPRGRVTNATGPHPFGAAWPDDFELSAKTGAARDASGLDVRWLVGRASRGPRAWTFASLVAGSPDTPALAAVELAARRLHEDGVF